MVSLKVSLGTAGCWLALTCAPAWAGQADVVAVMVAETGPGLYRFDVTVRHQDSGWEHYANHWEVAALDGRVMHHSIREAMYVYTMHTRVTTAHVPFLPLGRLVSLPHGQSSVA